MKPMTLVLDDAAIDQLKRYLAMRLAFVRPSHRMELVARGLGYRTYASFLAALREGPVSIDHVDPESALEFAERVGHEMDHDDLCEVLYGLFDLGGR